MKAVQRLDTFSTSTGCADGTAPWSFEDVDVVADAIVDLRRSIVWIYIGQDYRTAVEK